MVGLFIGSFNPPTKAHLEICKKLKKDFSKIVLVPVNSNDKELIDINRRIQMLNILKMKYPFIEISPVMRKYANLNYRIIDLLNTEYNGVNLIMGSDLLEKFHLFDNYQYLLEKYQFTIVPRNNVDVHNLIDTKFAKYHNKFKIINYHSNISSSKVKENLNNNKSVKSLLDRDVLKYIEDHHLY